MTTQSEQNRNESYHKLDINKSQKVVYQALVSLGKATNKQLADYLKFPINKITGRVRELRDKNVVKETGTVWDDSTRRNVTVFSPVYEVRQLQLF